MRNKLVTVIAVLSMIVVAVPALVAAQQTEVPVEPVPAVEGDFVTKIFKINYADVKDIASVISLFGGGTRPNPTLRVIAWTGPAADLPAVEAALQAGRRRMISWFDSVEMYTIPPETVQQYDPAGRVFVNLNTPQELAEAERFALSE